MGRPDLRSAILRRPPSKGSFRRQYRLIRSGAPAQGSGTDGNHANDAFSDGYIVLKGYESAGDLFDGSLYDGSTTSLFKLGRNGTSANLTTDGIRGWGSTSNRIDDFRHLYARNPSLIFGGGTAGHAVDANTWAFEIATYGLHIDSVHPVGGDETRIAIVRPAPSFPLVTFAPYAQDSVARTVSNASATIEFDALSASTSTLTKTGAGQLVLTFDSSWAVGLSVEQGKAEAPAQEGIVYLSSLNVGPTAAIDLDANDLVVENGKFGTIQALIFSGYRSSPDPTATGITSAASQNSEGNAMLLLFDNALAGATDWPVGSGHAIGANAIVRETHLLRRYEP